ncbi:unnamed protein product, partial [Timema podura]|nr:unnamed protein product [Timema podura]
QRIYNSPATKVHCITYTLQAADVPTQLTTTDHVNTTKCVPRGYSQTPPPPPSPIRCAQNINCAGAATKGKKVTATLVVVERKEVPATLVAVERKDVPAMLVAVERKDVPAT